MRNSNENHTTTNLHTLQWSEIDWQTVKPKVKKLQMRIAKAVNEDKSHRAKCLTRLLTSSMYAKLLAVKKVTTNKGKRTPGIDGIRWNTDKKKINAAFSLFPTPLSCHPA